MKTKLVSNHISIVILFFFPFLMTSCGHKFYTSNDGDLVVLKEKNDVHLSGTTDIGTNDKEIYNAQIGFSPIKHLGIAGSYFKYNQSGNSKNLIIRANEEIWSASFGGYFFQPLIPTGVSKRESRRRDKIQKNQQLFHPSGLLVDIYIGSSIGSSYNLYKEGGNSRLKFQKNYIQFGFHWTSRSINFDLVTRMGKLNYSKANIFGIIPSSTSNTFNYLESKNNFNLIEYSFRVNFGLKYSRLVFSVSGATQNSRLKQLGVVDAITTFGLILEIDEFFRKNKKEEIEKKINF